MPRFWDWAFVAWFLFPGPFVAAAFDSGVAIAVWLIGVLVLFCRDDWAPRERPRPRRRRKRGE